jgi:hypothetical protein
MSRASSPKYELAGMRLFAAVDGLDNLIFGEKLISWQAVRVSISWSIVLLFFCSAVLYNVNWTVLSENRVDFLGKIYVFWIIILLPLNIVLDFLSVAQTRIILREMNDFYNDKKAPTRWKRVRACFLFLFVDVILGFMFLFFIIIIASYFFKEYGNLIVKFIFLNDLYISPEIYRKDFLKMSDGGVNSTYLALSSLASSIFTSIWLWLYMLGWGIGACSPWLGSAATRIGGMFGPAATGCWVIAFVGLIPLYVWWV